MPVAKLDPEKCRRRNRLTALRGRNTAPVRFLLSPPAQPASVSARGTLPADDAEALKRINAILGRADADPLTADDVYLLYPEVGNTNYVSDRFMFLGRKTLRGIADSAAAGFAFMNSHRTGDLSTPSELPYGRTFAGRFEMANDGNGGVSARTVVGAYMLRGQSPNGANGPTTDDLYAGIKGGTIFDVSLGLYRGDNVCDVCGEDLRAYDPEEGYLCPHVPGTHRKMTAEEIDAQKARGVTDGVASYTLENAEAGEFSAVFDGAVPGAGFRKAVSLARAGVMSKASLSEANRAYRSLLITPGGPRAGPLSPRTKGRPMPSQWSLADLFGRIKAQPEHAEALGLGDLDELEEDEQPRVRATAARLSAPPAADPEVVKLREDLAAERKAREDDRTEREAERRKELAAKAQSDAKAFAAGLVKANKLMPAGAAAVADLHAFAHLSAAGLPTEGIDPVASVAGLSAALVPHHLTAEAVEKGVIPHGLSVLPNGSCGAEGPMTEARKREILQAHPDGAAALRLLGRGDAAR